MAGFCKQILVATDSGIHGVVQGPDGAAHAIVSLPLEAFDREAARRTLDGERGRDCLLVVPEHWMQEASFAFQSGKETLIRAFLERKLASAGAFAPQFYSYTYRQGPDGQGRLEVFYLREEHGAHLHATLRAAGFLPRAVTTPGRLWAQRLSHAMPEFDRQAALIVHGLPGGAYLYFYADGDLVFARRVVLRAGDDSPLPFEINQSLYLFSQKTKRELDRVYLFGKETVRGESLGPALARGVVELDFEGLVQGLHEDIAFLRGVWQAGGVPYPEPHRALIHREIRYRLRYRPVQWVGVATGALLALLLGIEALWLERTAAALRPPPDGAPAITLSQLEGALAELTERTGAPSAHGVLGRLANALPERVLLMRVALDLEAGGLELAALFPDEAFESFRGRLKAFLKTINTEVHPARPVGLEDVRFHLDELQPSELAGHRITLRVPLR